MAPSLIRTLVPVIVGWLLALAASVGLDIDSAALTSVLTSVLTGVYYLAVRWLESRWPALGWLLGLPTQPTYAPRHGDDTGEANVLATAVIAAALTVSLVGWIGLYLFHR